MDRRNTKIEFMGFLLRHGRKYRVFRVENETGPWYEWQPLTGESPKQWANPDLVELADRLKWRWNKVNDELDEALRYGLPTEGLEFGMEILEWVSDQIDEIRERRYE